MRTQAKEATPLTPAEAERLNALARRFRRGIPVVVLVTLPSAWFVWRDQGATMGLVLFGLLAGVELTSGLLLPWLFTWSVRRRGVSQASDDPASAEESR